MKAVIYVAAFFTVLGFAPFPAFACSPVEEIHVIDVGNGQSPNGKTSEVYKTEFHRMPFVVPVKE